MTPDELDALERKAKAARKGPLDIERRDDDCGYMNYIVHGGRGDYAWCRDELDHLARHNAEFIAAANPQAVLSLIALARSASEATAKLERLQAHFDAAAPEHNLPELLDLYFERQKSAEQKLERLESALEFTAKATLNHAAGEKGFPTFTEALFATARELGWDGKAGKCDALARCTA
jgi:hypothetical protein